MATNNHTDEGHRLPGLTARQSQMIRNLIRNALAERGLEAVVYADHVETAGGRSWGLQTLGSLCHGSASPAAWQGVVNRYVDDLLAKFPHAPASLTHDQIRAGVHLRLVQLDPRMADGFTYAREIGAGFHEVLAHKDGDYVRWINDRELAGLDIEEMRELGLSRLRDVAVDECQLLTGKGAEAFCLFGESGFIASKLLLLPELLRRYGGKRMRWPHGVLVAVPSRHRLVFAPVDDAVVDTLPAIAAVASYDYAHDHAPISPVVSWWKDGRLHPLFDPTASRLERPDRSCVEIPDEFWQARTRHLPGSEDVA
jgi:hypothetical protein